MNKHVYFTLDSQLYKFSLAQLAWLIFRSENPRMYIVGAREQRQFPFPVFQVWNFKLHATLRSERTKLQYWDASEIWIPNMCKHNWIKRLGLSLFIVRFGNYHHIQIRSHCDKLFYFVLVTSILKFGLWTHPFPSPSLCFFKEVK